MLLAEDLLLLAYNDDSGKQDSIANLHYGLAGAILIELGELGKIQIDGDGKKGKLRIVDQGPTGNPVLDEWLGKLGKYDGRKPSSFIGSIYSGLDKALLQLLAERGVLRAEKGKILGVFPTTRWPAADSSHEHRLRQRLHDVLVTGVEPDAHTAALIGLLSAIDAVAQVVDKPHRKAAKARAKEIAEGNWAADATQKALQDMMNAVMVAVMVPAITAGATAGN